MTVDPPASVRTGWTGRTAWPVPSDVVQIVHEGAPIPPLARGSVLTIGMFDGVHIGHQAVIARAVATATGLRTQAVVVTFDRHPASVVRPDAGVRLLTDLHQRADRIGRLGVDVVFVARFDEEGSLEHPRVFVDELVRAFAPQGVVVGEDFHFGHRRRGDLPLLETAGVAAGFKVEGVGAVSLDGIGRVSSTLIREAVAAGDVGLAARLVGRRPTFYAESGSLLVEAYLLDFDGDLYGEHTEVAFDTWIRGQVRFEGVDGLVAQLRSDVNKVREAAEAKGA